jgi:hypothetical protein
MSVQQPKRKNNIPGDRFTVMHNATSKERLAYIKDILGLSNTSQVVHMAIQQYYRAVKLEEETRTGNRVSNIA